MITIAFTFLSITLMSLPNRELRITKKSLSKCDQIVNGYNISFNLNSLLGCVNLLKLKIVSPWNAHSLILYRFLVENLAEPSLLCMTLEK